MAIENRNDDERHPWFQRKADAGVLSWLVIAFAALLIVYLAASLLSPAPPSVTVDGTGKAPSVTVTPPPATPSPPTTP